ncbi:putative HTH-type transcriptional regulator YsmB [Asanoa ishikariensis]|uniref:DNA-binding transcriptional regulator, MarR family n=1 Tax=Asanoa ishikariensis TaxID=137265 RepID=A0A1H3TYL7_9ACTN|nr:MarR family transcriptional regulator [Asanoa ishikariensis]GIF67648.1 putative HTH-type transcriptional regulator YsmB [Asanoa ishikariensis]SDZ54871.1 DNA-binding transcriptional regulator, MarR family [Asanoa ishikariensis]
MDQGESLSEAFWGVARRLRHLNRETMAPWEVTPAQWRAINVLVEHGPLRLGDLAEKLHIAPRSTTEVVDDLERRALVERHPDPADRRATLVALTTDGTAAATAIRTARTAESERFFGSLSTADRDHLSRILHDLAHE